MENCKAPDGPDAAVDDQCTSERASHSSGGGLLLTGPLQLLASTPQKFPELAGGESLRACSASGANGAMVGSSLTSCIHTGMPLANAPAAEASPWRQICTMSQDVNVDQHSPALCHAERFQKVRSESVPCCDWETSEDEIEMPGGHRLDPGRQPVLSNHDSPLKANSTASEPVRDSQGGSETDQSTPERASGDCQTRSTCGVFLASYSTMLNSDC